MCGGWFSDVLFQFFDTNTTKTSLSIPYVAMIPKFTSIPTVLLCGRRLVVTRYYLVLWLPTIIPQYTNTAVPQEHRRSVQRSE